MHTTLGLEEVELKVNPSSFRIQAKAYFWHRRHYLGPRAECYRLPTFVQVYYRVSHKNSALHLAHTQLALAQEYAGIRQKMCRVVAHHEPIGRLSPEGLSARQRGSKIGAPYPMS